MAAQQSGPTSNVDEVTLPLGYAGMVSVVAVPYTSFSPSLASHSLSGRKLKLEIRGPQKNLPNPTPARIAFVITPSDGSEPREFAVGPIPLSVSGSSASLTCEVDLLEAQMTGKCTVTATVIPDFPFAEEATVVGAVALDNPLSIKLDYGAPLRFGDMVTLTPEVASMFGDCRLRLTVYEDDSGEIDKDHKAVPIKPQAQYFWDGGDFAARRWRAGCTSTKGDPVLTYLEDDEVGASFELGFYLEGSPDEGKTWYPTWKLRSSIAVPKPMLRELTLDVNAAVAAALLDADPLAAIRTIVEAPAPEAATAGHRPPRHPAEIRAKGVISGFGAGLRLPLELTLWGHQPFDPRSTNEVTKRVSIITRVATPVQAHLEDDGTFDCVLVDLRAVFDDPRVLDLAGKRLFAVLRIPPSVTGTDDYAPVYQVVDYAGGLTPFADEDLAQSFAPEPKEKKGAKAKAPKPSPTIELRKKLGVGVASAEIAGLTAISLPSFGPVLFGARGENLLVHCRLHGDLRFWKKASPTFVVTQGKTTFEVEGKPSSDDPRTLEALLKLTDERILGKTITVHPRTTKKDVQVDGLPALPDKLEGISNQLDCVPRLRDLVVSCPRQADETGEERIVVSCRADYFPGGTGAKHGLRVRFFEYFRGVESPIELSGLVIDLDFRLDSDALCDATGRLVARILDPDSVARFRKGRFAVRVDRIQDRGVVFGRKIDGLTTDFGDAEPRAPTGKVIFASKIKGDFRAKVLAVAESLGVEPAYLIACMAFETGETFSPSVKNAQSGAVGLIQFTTDAATSVDSTKEALAAMSDVAQMDAVSKYFKLDPWKSKLKNTMEDIYARILCPAAVGEGDDHPMYKRGTKEYEQNEGLDADHDGVITKAEAAAKVREKYWKGMGDAEDVK